MRFLDVQDEAVPAPCVASESRLQHELDNAHAKIKRLESGAHQKGEEVYRREEIKVQHGEEGSRREDIRVRQGDEGSRREEIKVRRNEQTGRGKEGEDNSGSSPKDSPCPVGFESMTSDALFDRLHKEEAEIRKVTDALSVRSAFTTPRDECTFAPALPPPSPIRVRTAWPVAHAYANCRVGSTHTP